MGDYVYMIEALGRLLLLPLAPIAIATIAVRLIRELGTA